jgi:hypothetical protein
MTADHKREIKSRISRIRPLATQFPKQVFLGGNKRGRLFFAVVLTFTASLIAQIVGVSNSSAGPCTYTSSDKKKGYKC